MEDQHTSSRAKRLMSDQTSSSLSSIPPTDANPAAEMLQDMIREKRAASQRTKKAFDPITRLANGDKIELKETQSSPVASLSSRGRPSMTARRASGANVKPTVQKEMGLREMSEHISKVDKQNFDLKLEVFHRRQRNDVLEARIQRLEAYEADYEDLQAKYTALLLESDRQKMILDDAVAQICELQAENEELQADKEELQAAIGGHFAGIREQEASNQATEHVSLANGIPVVPATPPQAIRKASRSSINNRQNSAISSKSSTSRRDMMAIPARGRSAKSDSLYSSDDSLNQANKSFISVDRAGCIFNGDDDDLSIDRQMLHSPRLSILSESGFSSIYGSPRDNSQPVAHAGDDESSSPPPSEAVSINLGYSAQRDARIDLWMQDRPAAPKSGKRSPKTKAETKPNQQYTSIEEVLSKRPVRMRDEVNVPYVQIPPRQSSSVERSHENQYRRERKSPPKSPSHKPRSYSSSNGSMVFGGKMPPTPDTMSTTTIGGPSSSTQSIITEKSLLDHGGPPSKGYANLVNYGRPHTSDSNSHHHAHHSSSDPKGQSFDEELSLNRSFENADVQKITTEKYGHDRNVAPPFVQAHSGLEQLPAAESQARPALTSYQTDMMANGDGFALVQPSRTLSYPSPRRRLGPSSAHPLSDSPTKGRNQKGFDASEISTKTILTDGTADMKEVSVTGTKNYSVKEKPSNIKGQQPGEENNLPASINLHYAEASRSRFGRFQFFKRTNSQNTGNKSNTQVTSPRPRPVRSHSSTRAQPSSLKQKMSNGSRPGTSDGHSPTTIPRPLQSSNSRRHSAILDHAASFLPGGTGPKEHSRRLSDTRQTLKNDDNYSKWPLGRTASSKIKEGFGLKRSQAS